MQRRVSKAMPQHNHAPVARKTAASKGFPPRVSTVKIISVRGKGSMSISTSAGGHAEFRANRQQLLFLAACVDVARLYNDESLAEQTDALRRNNQNPERSRWYRDGIQAAENNRRNDAECERLRKSIDAYDKSLKARANRIGL
jgi:hypothetical protein